MSAIAFVLCVQWAVIGLCIIAAFVMGETTSAYTMILLMVAWTLLLLSGRNRKASE